MSYSGSCVCGKVKFDLQGQPDACLVCYCHDCRKGSGNLGQLLAQYNSKNLKIIDNENSLTEYIITKTESGKPKKKYFCNNCGCNTHTVPMSANGEISFVRYTLIDDDFSNLIPTTSIFNDEKQKITAGKTCEYY